MTEYRAHVERSFQADGYTLYVAGPRMGGRSDVLRSDGSWEPVLAGEMASGPLGIYLPRDAWQAIQDLVNPPLDLKYLQEALEVERNRVNDVLSKLLTP